jgi:hypothetical protein
MMVSFSISSRNGTKNFEVKQAYAVDNLKVTLIFPINSRQLTILHTYVVLMS